MPLFSYKAKTATGQSVFGQIEARDKVSALDMIMSGGQTPIQLKEVGQTSDWKSWFQYQPQHLSAADVGAFSQDLARLLGSGFSLHQALQMVVVSTDSKRVQTLAGICADHVSKGGALSHILAKETGGPVQALAGLVKAGEASGELEIILMSAGSSFQAASEFREKLASSLIYPMIILFMISLTLIVFFSFVLPRLEPLFEGIDDRLPLATRMLLGFGNFMEIWMPWLMAVGLLLFIGIQVSSPLRARIQRWRDKLVLGRLGLGVPVLTGFASYARTLGLLINSGVPLPSANAVAAGGQKNKVLSEAFVSLTPVLREGQSLSSELQAITLTPDLLVRMTSLGERSGRLGPSLIDAAGILERKAQTRTDLLLAALTPAITIFLGLLVTLVVGSLFLGIATLTDVQI